MSEVLAQEVINHQLEGIMFHAGMLDLFISLGLKKLERIQEHQLIDEIKTHVKTKREVFCCKGKMIQAKAGVAPDISIKPAETEEEKKSIARQTVRKWREWEVKTIAVYADACKKEPACKLWQKLRHGVEREIKHIDKIMCWLG